MLQSEDYNLLFLTSGKNSQQILSNSITENLLCKWCYYLLLTMCPLIFQQLSMFWIKFYLIFYRTYRYQVQEDVILRLCMPEDFIQNASQFKLVDTDTVLVGYPRSGMTWLSYILFLLRRGGQQIDFTERWEYSAYFCTLNLIKGEPKKYFWAEGN